MKGCRLLLSKLFSASNVSHHLCSKESPMSCSGQTYTYICILIRIYVYIYLHVHNIQKWWNKTSERVLPRWHATYSNIFHFVPFCSISFFFKADCTQLNWFHYPLMGLKELFTDTEILVVEQNVASAKPQTHPRKRNTHSVLEPSSAFSFRRPRKPICPARPVEPDTRLEC